MPAPFNLYQKIGSIVLALTANIGGEELPVTYKYLRKSEENVNADNHAFPAIVFIEPDQHGWTANANGNLNRFTNCFFQVITQFEMGQNATARESAIEDMKALAERFLHKVLNDDDFLVYITDINSITLVDKYDANVVGVELNLAKLVYTQPTPC